METSPLRFLFFSPMAIKPTGGIRVIYNYVARLREMGFEAYVYHPLDKHKYQYADENVPIFKGNIITSSDHLVIPDVFVSQISDSTIDKNQNYSLLIQNPYILRSMSRYSDLNKLLEAINGASRVLCISDDAIEMILRICPSCEHKVMRVTWSLDPEKFVNQKHKERLITYMPRKNITHINLLLECLHASLPSNWRFQAIEGVSQKELCNLLAQSSIFLQFGFFEGLPAPPVEAALSGNYVIGYHGNGGREYWKKPNFTNVNVGDISNFSQQILALITRIDSMGSQKGELEDGISGLVMKFSVHEEREYLEAFVNSVSRDASAHSLKSRRTKLPFKKSYLNYLFSRVLTRWIQIKNGY